METIGTVSEYLTETAYNCERYRYSVVFTCAGHFDNRGFMIEPRQVYKTLWDIAKRHCLPVIIDLVRDSIEIKPKNGCDSILSLDGTLGMEILRVAQGLNPEHTDKTRAPQLIEKTIRTKHKHHSSPVVWRAMGRNTSLDSGLL